MTLKYLLLTEMGNDACCRKSYKYFVNTHHALPHYSAVKTKLIKNNEKARELIENSFVKEKLKFNQLRKNTCTAYSHLVNLRRNNDRLTVNHLPGAHKWKDESGDQKQFDIFDGSAAEITTKPHNKKISKIVETLTLKYSSCVNKTVCPTDH